MPNLVRLGGGILSLLPAISLSLYAGVSFADPYFVGPSPPVVSSPIHACAKAVHVTGFASHSLVQVFSDADPATPIGQDTPNFPSADIALNRALVAGEKISALQVTTKDGVSYTSMKSLVPVEVTTFTGTLTKPTVERTIYECGHIVPVGTLTESSTVSVFANGATPAIGQEDSPGQWHPVFTTDLVTGQGITASQALCGLTSAISASVPVLASPSTIPIPHVDNAVLGSDSILASSLLVGAYVQAFDGATEIGAGFATASSNWVPINIKVASTSSITVTQQLCGTPTVKSPPATIVSSLPNPVLVDPIYEGQQFVFVRNLLPNSTVYVKSGTEIIAIGGGGPGSDGALVLALGRAAIAGESLSAYAQIGDSPLAFSNTVVVLPAAGQPTTTDSPDGDPFFVAETGDGEQQIPGAVYPRGRGDGPLIRAIGKECASGVTVKVTGPTGSVNTVTAPQQGFPGYFTTRLAWTSLTSGTVPDGVPVGKYQVDVTNLCDSKTAQQFFYVIFDPKEVDAADRFGFNETTIWFYAGAFAEKYTTESLAYTLHPDDNRVFSKAIGVVNGMTNQHQATQAMLQFEHDMFGYTISESSDDVLQLMAKASHKAQCADDSAMLVALLRSVGIPSHTNTVDAASESGAIRWGFDTWAEARLNGPSGLRWYALYPHTDDPDLPLGPLTRNQAGTTWSLIGKGLNDITVMANADWVASDLDKVVARFHLDPTTTCHEPAENFDYKASWLDCLCNYPSADHYWNEGHWECSPGYNTDIEINVLNTYWVGNTVNVEVIVHNPTSTAKTGTLSVDLGVDKPRTKILPDFEFNLGGATISIPAGSSSTHTFSYTLPVASSEADQYSIIAKTNFVSSHPADSATAGFEVKAFYDVALELPANLHSCPAGVSCPLDATLRITNRTANTVNNLDFTINLPFGVQNLSGGKTFSVFESTLGPNAVITRYIPLRIVEPNDAASFGVDATTVDGGNTSTHVTVAIDPPGPSIFNGSDPTVPVAPNQPPVAKCRNVTRAAAASCQATVTAADVNDGSYDPDGPLPTCTLVPTGSFSVGATPVMLTCVDNKGASSACHASVTVTETTQPTITCPVSVLAPCTGGTGAPVTFTVTANDTCGVQSVTCTRASGSTFPLGSTVNTCTAVDNAGNTASCSFSVTVALGDNPICCPAGTNIIQGDSNNNTLIGTAGSDCILAKGGQDLIRGNGGNDYISGGDGDDVINAGDGNDVVFGGTGQDTLNGDEGNDVMYGGDGDDIIRGWNGSDVLVGGQGQDKIYGGAGNDVLIGEDGDDYMEGNDGDDTLIGGGLHDNCLGGPGTDTFQSCERKTQ